jgi:hypothetical protein
MDHARRIGSNNVPFALETPFSFESDRSATRGRSIKTIVAKKNLTSFLAVFKMFHVCVCTRFENNPIFIIKNIYTINSPVCERRIGNKVPVLNYLNSTP